MCGKIINQSRSHKNKLLHSFPPVTWIINLFKFAEAGRKFTVFSQRPSARIVNFFVYMFCRRVDELYWLASIPGCLGQHTEPPFGKARLPTCQWRQCLPACSKSVPAWHNYLSVGQLARRPPTMQRTFSPPLLSSS